MLQPAVQGATHTGQAVTWKRIDGTPQDLTGATISGRMRSARGVNAPAAAMVSTFTPTVPASGQFLWTYAPADVVTAGVFVVQFTANYGVGGNDLTFEDIWQVRGAV